MASLKEFVFIQLEQKLYKTVSFFSFRGKQITQTSFLPQFIRTKPEPGNMAWKMDFF